MKNVLPLFILALLFASCEKEEINTLVSPIPPATIRVTYLVHSVDPQAETLSRKITYVSDWKKDSTGNAVTPVLTTVVAIGNFTITVEMTTIHVPVGTSHPGKFNCMVPSGIGWESTDGKNSLTVVEIKNEDSLVAKKSGGCVSSGRSFFTADVYLYDMYW